MQALMESVASGMVSQAATWAGYFVPVVLPLMAAAFAMFVVGWAVSLFKG